MFRYCASSVFALCMHYSYNSALVSWVFFFFFFLVIALCFFFLLNIDVSWHLYCYIDTTNFTIFSQLLICQFLTSRNKIIKYETVANYNCIIKAVMPVAATVLWFHESFLLLFSFFFFVIGLFFFFLFKYWCKLTFILLYWHNKFHNIFTIIDVSISYKLK